MLWLRFLLVVGAALFVATAPAAAQRYANTTPLSLTSSAVASSPYGTTISVAGAPSRVATLRVSIENISHTFSGDLQALLVAPGGQTVALLGGVGGNSDLFGQTWTFSHEAATQLPGPAGVPVSGVYRPSVFSLQAFPAPAPPPIGSYSTDLSSLYGTNPNGVWTLYVSDIVPTADNGTVAGGWSIEITGEIERGFNYQGVLSNAAGPIQGDANVRFALMPSLLPFPGEQPLAPAITRSFTGVAGGLVSTILDFGPPILANRPMWLAIDVESPPGSGFSPLLPRQPLTIAPHAGRALVATLADRATNAATAAVAQSANSVAWANITGVPASVSTPIRTTQVNVERLPNETLPASMPLTISGANSTLTLNAGRIIVNWTLTGYSTAPTTGFRFRVVCAGVAGPWSQFFFNAGSQHQTISGTALLTVPGGSQPFRMEVMRTAGPGAFVTDINDSFSATIINLRD